ncbi:hypothetical protein ARMA_0252 [Ardenticatena maritima]|uniref:Uncharacterized protein n=1 Tax=Ardenticatena maritima TaxID=872965 RepID=A0A0M8K739_9CHLR|nr:hypothetical protein ARMA_0252 [Ardenticatena maritima]
MPKAPDFVFNGRLVMKGGSPVIFNKTVAFGGCFLYSEGEDEPLSRGG